MSCIDLHADAQAPHDFVTREGSFARTCALLEEAHSQRQSLEVRTRLTRATFRHLQGMPRILKGAGVQTWHLRSPTWDNGPIPRLAMAWPHALRAAKEAESAGITVLTHGAPRCVLGPYARLAAEEESSAFGEKCKRCAARTACCGVDEGYLARFGDEDLRALA